MPELGFISLAWTTSKLFGILDNNDCFQKMRNKQPWFSHVSASNDYKGFMEMVDDKKKLVRPI